MNRRSFISLMSKYGVAAAAVTATATAAAKGKSMMESSADGLSGRVDALKKKVDALEENQKNYLRALCLIAAISTGIDLSVLI